MHVRIDGLDCKRHGHGEEKWMEVLEAEGIGLADALDKGYCATLPRFQTPRPSISPSRR